MNPHADTPLYQQLADRMETMIESGSLRAGDRIPSVRQLSIQHHVSVPTVMQAYTVLENRSLIEARPKSGFYVRPRLANFLRAPATAKYRSSVSSLNNFVSGLSMADDMVDPSLVPFGAALPGEDLLPMEKLARLTASTIRRYPAACMKYDPAPGCLPLRKELSRRSLDWGCSFSADEFVVTVGASEALHLALLTLTKPGDTVMVESPSYYGTLNLMARLKLRVLAIPACPGEGLDISAAAKAMAKHKVAAIIVVPNFSNPLGSLMPERSRRELLELAEKHATPIIEDDIYGDIPHDGPRPQCLKAIDEKDQVILCGSFSKTLAPGYRVGYIVAGKYHQHVLELKHAFNLGGASLPSLVIAEFLKTGGYERHLRKLRHTYRQQVCKMRDALAQHFPEMKVSNPSGGFLLWVEFPESLDVLPVFHEARAAGISFAPGPLFSPDGRFRNCLRLSCGYPWSDRMETALATLGKILKRHLGE